jgi:hypothetical protein
LWGGHTERSLTAGWAHRRVWCGIDTHKQQKKLNCGLDTQEGVVWD